MGWKNSLGNGVGVNTISSGLEGAWTTNPAKWDVEYLENLFKFEWELTKSPAGAQQWTPKNGAGAGRCRMLMIRPGSMRFMLTSDLALRFDASYEKISRDYLTNPEKFAEAFAKAWYKLTHRDMGPIARYLGPLVPKEQLIWQDPVPAVDHELIGEAEAAGLKAKILASGLSISQLCRRRGHRLQPSVAATSAAGPTERAFALRRRVLGGEPADRACEGS